MELELAACPICRARGSFARGTTEVEGRSRATLECVECGSVLMRLGDDLWTEGDRWAYQKVGRADAAFLLHRPLTTGELEWLAGSDRLPSPVSSQPLPPSAEPPAAYAQPPTISHSQSGMAAERPSYLIPDQPAYPSGPTQDRSGPRRRGAAPVLEPVPPPVLERPSSSATSPLLINSMLVMMLCMAMYLTAIIALKNFGAKSQPESTAVAETTPATLVPTRPPLVTQTPLAAGAPVAAEASPIGSAALPAATSTVASALLPAETPFVTGTPPAAGTVPPPAGPSPTGAASTALRLQGVSDYQAADGILYVLGEVANTSGENLASVEIDVSLIDAGGQVVAMASTFTELSIVETTQTAPFKLAIPPPLPTYVTYTLQVDYTATGEDLVGLEVLSHTASTDANGLYHITGELRNSQAAAVKLPKIVATYYNAANEVIRVEALYLQVPSLQPDGVLPFDIILADPPADLDHYAVQTEAVWDKPPG